MKAKLIGERSAGMTAVEIYDRNDNLVWSHRFFDKGCDTAGYISGLCDAFDCLHDSADVEMFDGGVVDEDGSPVSFDTCDSTGVMLEYDSETTLWSVADNARSYGQSAEIIDACMLLGLVEADADNERKADAKVVIAIADHIKSKM